MLILSKVPINRKLCKQKENTLFLQKKRLILRKILPNIVLMILAVLVMTIKVRRKNRILSVIIRKYIL